MDQRIRSFLADVLALAGEPIGICVLNADLHSTTANFARLDASAVRASRELLSSLISISAMSGFGRRQAHGPPQQTRHPASCWQSDCLPHRQRRLISFSYSDLS
jgi:hypothetical protein